MKRADATHLTAVAQRRVYVHRTVLHDGAGRLQPFSEHSTRAEFGREAEPAGDSLVQVGQVPLARAEALTTG